MATERHWLKYFEEPSHIGPLATANAVGQAGGGCGDLVRVYLEIKNDNVSKAAFMASGCPAAIAGASACAEIVEGLDFLEVAAVNVRAIGCHLKDIPDDRYKCLELSSVALAEALENYAASKNLRFDKSDLVVVAMSGGVDSSIASVKLLQEGRDVLGLTLRLHDFAAKSPRSCCGPIDITDARNVAAMAGFPHLVIDMRPQFKSEVIDNFCQAYLEGLTPNPCVECNRNLRFTHLMKKIIALGASKMATGHYARISEGTDGRFELRRARDLSKDQSYMFWSATQEVLSRLITPIGDLHKAEVRELAFDLGLPVASKQESQDVCFVPDGDYAGFICRTVGHTPGPGPIIDTDGRVIGEHKGFIYYTVGQRRGLDISSTVPLYVLRIEPKINQLTVGEKNELIKKRFHASSINLINPESRQTSYFKATVMTRYNSEPVPASVNMISKTRAVVEFARPHGPIAPGQSAVFYDEGLVLGGGIIE